MSKEAMKLALDALLGTLAKPEQEPVGEITAEDWGRPFNAIRISTHFYKEIPPVGTKLYTTPQPPAQPLTDEEIERVCIPLGAAMLSFTEVARAIEAAHGIKGDT